MMCDRVGRFATVRVPFIITVRFRCLCYKSLVLGSVRKVNDPWVEIGAY